MSNLKINTVFVNVFLLVFAIIFFIPFLGNVHLFDWDEINFAEIAREMVITNKYSQPQINYQLFTEKPPLFFWMQVVCIKLFGNNEFAARLPNALLGLIVLPVLFTIGKKLKDSLFGLLWALVYVCSILPHLYFKSGIIDPWFNFFIFIALYAIIRATEKKQNKQNNITWIIFAGVMAGLAILTKGPVAAILIGITLMVFWISKKFKWFISPIQILLFIFTTLFVCGIWLGADYLQNGPKFIKEFTIRQWELLTTADAGHGGFFFYHFFVLFFGCFPAIVFFIQSVIKKEIDSSLFGSFKKWMLILFWVVLIIFTLVQTKIVHYSSLTYYPISFLAANSLYNIFNKKWQFVKWQKWITIITSLPFVIAPIAIVYLMKNKSQLQQLVKQDAFAAENIKAEVYFSGFEVLPSILLIIVLVFTFYFFKKQQNKKAIWVLLGGSAIYIQLTLFFLIGKIEAISQRANVAFWKQHSTENCYVASYGFKTYAHYYYANIKQQPNEKQYDLNWLFTGEIDLPVYISCKITSRQEIENNIKDIQFLYQKNGFCFYKRMPKLL